MYKKELANNYLKLEWVISNLSKILNQVGYYPDKKIRTINSGQYDIAHMTYATACDKFYTEDKKLYYRTKAIYYYLGIPTDVILFNEENL